MRYRVQTKQKINLPTKNRDPGFSCLWLICMYFSHNIPVFYATVDTYKCCILVLYWVENVHYSVACHFKCR